MRIFSHEWWNNIPQGLFFTPKQVVSCCYANIPTLGKVNPNSIPNCDIINIHIHQWCGPRPSVLGQAWSETKKFGLGLAGLLLCCETRSCHARRHNDLERHSNFSSTIYGRTLSDASMLYFADVFLNIFFYGRLSWPNGWTDLHETFTRGRY